MKVYDPGHHYGLLCFNGPTCPYHADLRFMKREGENYPGNVGVYSGTNMQEVLRALIDRIIYLNHQKKNWTNQVVLFCFRLAINMLEYRAARRHGRKFWPHWKIERINFDVRDGHIRFSLEEEFEPAYRKVRK